MRNPNQPYTPYIEVLVREGDKCTHAVTVTAESTWGVYTVEALVNKLRELGKTPVFVAHELSGAETTCRIAEGIVDAYSTAHDIEDGVHVGSFVAKSPYAALVREVIEARHRGVEFSERNCMTFPEASIDEDMLELPVGFETGALADLIAQGTLEPLQPEVTPKLTSLPEIARIFEAFNGRTLEVRGVSDEMDIELDLREARHKIEVRRISDDMDAMQYARAAQAKRTNNPAVATPYIEVFVEQADGRHIHAATISAESVRSSESLPALINGLQAKGHKLAYQAKAWASESKEFTTTLPQEQVCDIYGTGHDDLDGVLLASFAINSPYAQDVIEVVKCSDLTNEYCRREGDRFPNENIGSSEDDEDEDYDEEVDPLGERFDAAGLAEQMEAGRESPLQPVDLAAPIGIAAVIAINEIFNGEVMELDGQKSGVAL